MEGYLKNKAVELAEELGEILRQKGAKDVEVIGDTIYK
jgi:hypothetical protein